MLTLSPEAYTVRGFLLLLLCLAGFTRLVLFAVRRAQRQKLIQQHGCAPAPQLPNSGLFDRLTGLPTAAQWFKDFDQGCWQQACHKAWFANGTKTYYARVLNQPSYFTADAENLKAVLSSQFEDFGLGDARDDFMRPVLGHGIFTTDGKAWERSRAMLRPNFNRERIADLVALERHVQNLFDNLPTDSSVVDIQSLFFKFTMDYAVEFLFGLSTNLLVKGGHSPEAVIFSAAFQSNTAYMHKASLSGRFMRWVPDSQFRKDKRIIHQYADKLLSQATDKIKSGDKLGVDQEYIFLHELLKQTQDPYVLRSELLNVLLAGRDTTAGLLGNTFWLLARHPRVWNQLKAEIAPLNGQLPTYEDIKSVKYLRYVINEVLRLYPQVPTNSRIAARDTTLPRGGGRDGRSPVFVAQGTFVRWLIWSTHRLPEYYGDDADKFRPERWEKLRPSWEYLPFNGGPRICIGQQFALLEASYALVRILQRFDRIEPVGDDIYRESLHLTLSVKDGVQIRLYKS